MFVFLRTKVGVNDDRTLILGEISLKRFQIVVLSRMQSVGLRWHFNLNLKCDYLQRVFIENLDALHNTLSYYKGEQNIYCVLWKFLGKANKRRNSMFL